MSLRLKSAIWVDALLRRNSLQGNFGAVLHRGAEDAGAVYVLINHLNGNYSLLAPAPGSSHDDNGERLWIMDHKEQHLTWDQVREKMARRRAVDNDLWLVEIEDRNGVAGLTTEKM